MTDTVIGAVATINGLRVISRTSSMRFKNAQLSRDVCGAIEYIRQAKELDPLNAFVNSLLAVLLLAAGRHEDAHETLVSLIEMAPQYALAHQVRALLLDEQGRYSDAIEELQRALGLFGASSLLTGALGRAYARAGQRDRARQLLHELEATERGAGIDPVAAALVHVGLGEADEAFKRLGEACEYRSTQLLWLQVSSVWEPLRSGPRFQQLLTKNGRISTAFTRSLPSESPPAV